MSQFVMYKNSRSGSGAPLSPPWLLFSCSICSLLSLLDMKSCWLLLSPSSVCLYPCCRLSCCCLVNTFGLTPCICTATLGPVSAGAEGWGTPGTWWYRSSDHCLAIGVMGGGCCGWRLALTSWLSRRGGTGGSLLLFLL